MEFQVNGAFRDLVERARSVRRFDESARVGESFLTGLVDLARICPNAANRQRLRFKVVADSDGCATVFENLAWAGALKDWSGPAEGECPTGYVAIAAERAGEGKPANPMTEVDAGIAAQTMMLAARFSMPAVGACMFKAFKPSLAAALGIDARRYELKLVMAFGAPAEEIRLEPPLILAGRLDRLLARRCGRAPCAQARARGRAHLAPRRVYGFRVSDGAGACPRPHGELQSLPHKLAEW